MLLAATVTLFLALVALVALRRVELRASFRGSVSEAGGFGAAGGAELGPFAVTGAMQNGEAVWAIHVLGRRITRVRTNAPARAREGRLARWRRRLRTADVVEFVEKGLGRVRFEDLHARVRCGSTDPLLTGRVAGVLAVASAVLAPVARIETDLDWGAEAESLDVSGDLRTSFVPGLVIWDLVRLASGAVAAAARDTMKQRNLA